MTIEKPLGMHEQRFKIANEIANRAGEGGAFVNLADAYHSLGNFVWKSVIGPAKEHRMEISVLLTSHWVIIEKL